jgi:hypothetical protein
LLLGVHVDVVYGLLFENDGIYLLICIDGWMDGWMDGIYLLICIDGWVDGYMDGYLDGYMNG